MADSFVTNYMFSGQAYHTSQRDTTPKNKFRIYMLHVVELSQVGSNNYILLYVLSGKWYKMSQVSPGFFFFFAYFIYFDK